MRTLYLVVRIEDEQQHVKRFLNKIELTVNTDMKMRRDTSQRSAFFGHENHLVYVSSDMLGLVPCFYDRPFMLQGFHGKIDH